ncbi:MAG: hypothetical protein AB3N64_13770 [Puniceicoccaceae bacterium]
MCAKKFKLKPTVSQPYSTLEQDHKPVDSRQILQENTERGLTNESFEVTERPRRKRRDYLVLMVLGNLLLLIPLLLFLPNLFISVSCLSGMVLYSVGISWVMWGVMGDY